MSNLQGSKEVEREGKKKGERERYAG